MRVVKFVKWLKKLGWEPVVLTVKRHDTFMPDESLLKEIDGIEIYRCGDYFRGIIRSVLIKLFKEKNEGGKISRFIWRHDNSSFSRIDKIKRLLYDIICIPDECFGWILPALIEGRKIIQTKKITFIFSTCPPFTNHIVGYFLKRICGVLLILDYRDKWSGNIQFDAYTVWRRKINRWFESIAINKCDYVITTTVNHTKYFRDEHKADKVELIYNGYDEEDFNFKVPKKINKDKMIFNHVGKLADGRVLHNILIALECLDEDLLKNIELNLVGRLSEENEICIKKSRVAQIINKIGHCSHHDALKMMFQSDVLLHHQFLDDNIAAKIFEYVRVSKPILAVCPRNSEIWNLIAKYNIGVCIDSNDHEGIKKAIILLYNQWKDGTLTFHSSADLLEKFDRKKQAQQLINLFERVSIDSRK